SRNQLTCGDLWQILLLRGVSGEVDNRQEADPTLSAECRRKRSGTADVLADQRATCLVQAESAIFFGDVCADESEVSRFADDLARQFPIVLLELVEARDDFVVDKLPRGLGNHAVLFSKIFRREDLVSSALFNQERATFNNLFLFGYGGHEFDPFCY